MWSGQNKALESYVRTILAMVFGSDMGSVAEMNSGKKGRPFSYPDEMIEWGMILKEALHLPYRQAAGVMGFISSIVGIPCIKRSQLCRRAAELARSGMRMCKVTDARVLAMGTGNVPSRKGLTVAIDSTCLRLNEAGRWMIEHWDGKEVNSWIKVHAAVDTSTDEVLAYVITGPDCGDRSCFIDLIDLMREKGFDVKKVLADSAYDDRRFWNEMKERKIGFIANIRKNATGNFNGCSSRGLQALRRLEVGEEQWKAEVGYGIRWKVECTFSDLKRLLAFMLRARDQDMMACEVFWKIGVHNLYKGIRADLMGVS